MEKDAPDSLPQRKERIEDSKNPNNSKQISFFATKSGIKQ
jgi:hypothetical protein